MANLLFFPGLHQPSDAKHFKQCCISINRIRDRKSDFEVDKWMMDSGAFTELFTYGAYRHEPAEYAASALRWVGVGNLLCIVSQDYMCEPFILEKTGLTVLEHQRLTIERYDELVYLVQGKVYVMPVIQGYKPREYQQHIDMYGDRLKPGQWTGLGSVCKRNSNVISVEEVLSAANEVRSDLPYHGFGLKTTALASGLVRSILHSADSMAWSYAARREGRNANDWREAKRFADNIDSMSYQQRLFI